MARTTARTMEQALEAIAGMQITEDTNTGETLALCVAIAKTELGALKAKITVKQLQRASKSQRRYGLYTVLKDGERIGFIEKAFHTSSFRVGSRQVFSSLKTAINHIEKRGSLAKN